MTPEHVAQIETLMQTRGEELYQKVLAANMDTQAIWFAIRPQLADLRVEITTGVAEAAAVPWELMRDPQSDSAIGAGKIFCAGPSQKPLMFLLPGFMTRIIDGEK